VRNIDCGEASSARPPNHFRMVTQLSQGSPCKILSSDSALTPTSSEAPTTPDRGALTTARSQVHRGLSRGQACLNGCLFFPEHHEAWPARLLQRGRPIAPAKRASRPIAAAASTLSLDATRPASTEASPGFNQRTSSGETQQCGSNRGLPGLRGDERTRDYCMCSGGIGTPRQ